MVLTYYGPILRTFICLSLREDIERKLNYLLFVGAERGNWLSPYWSTEVFLSQKKGQYSECQEDTRNSETTSLFSKKLKENFASNGTFIILNMSFEPVEDFFDTSGSTKNILISITLIKWSYGSEGIIIILR